MSGRSRSSWPASTSFNAAYATTGLLSDAASNTVRLALTRPLAESREPNPPLQTTLPSLMIARANPGIIALSINPGRRCRSSLPESATQVLPLTWAPATLDITSRLPANERRNLIIIARCTFALSRSLACHESPR